MIRFKGHSINYSLEYFQLCIIEIEKSKRKKARRKKRKVKALNSKEKIKRKFI